MISSLAQLLELMRHHGANRVYAKILKPNDNRKNQIYLSSGFSALNLIPHGEIYTDTRPIARSKQDRPKANVLFFWIDQNGKHHAPNAQLILYPDYPEVRLSGLLRGCKPAPSHLIKVRDPGRVLVLGVTEQGEVLGHALDVHSPISAEIRSGTWEQLGVFLELPLSLGRADTPKALLLAELRRIHELRWIMSQKLGRDGSKLPYVARNGGGYTLEAELGISPNGRAEPDFMGWEVKQYGVNDFSRLTPKSPVTLMTPEPTGGIYRGEDVPAFMRRFGYADKSGKVDRLNFGGVYICGRDFHADTGLRMTMDGFDPTGKGKITDIEGGISLRDREGNAAAEWSFKGLMQHWNRKHAQAAYVPSLFRSPPPEYAYGPRILLCEGTDFILFLKALAAGAVYYDPAIKMENASSANPKIKPRSQFRVNHRQVTEMYHSSETMDLTAR